MKSFAVVTTTILVQLLRRMIMSLVSHVCTVCMVAASSCGPVHALLLHWQLFDLLSGEMSQAEEKQLVEAHVEEGMAAFSKLADTKRRERARAVAQAYAEATKDCISLAEAEAQVHTAIDIAYVEPEQPKDYAWRAAGGQVVQKRGLTSATHTRTLLERWQLALGMEAGVGGPNEAISSDNSLSACWGMDGQSGQLTVKLAIAIRVDAITLEHASAQISPDRSSAPKTFHLLGLVDESAQPVPLLQGEYDLSASPQQLFRVPVGPYSQTAFSIVTLKVLDNHGKPEYTCIYRLQVHGRELQ
eukprot:TRINITY_DN2021_c0_g1_i2.p1 TRINITY_DN2021_c0_g1~~TRINITY_DN2021_c0_g1_i2.p1  ORF type:complete len:301 (+),score=34.82 TRINITY_DN2021_c0_g1_i2:491-1393(+)